ncbi:PIM3 kinase, partial [Certhia brachydactyla]|nr:PIM3 kinase [Certhia brachydactyla]
PLGTHAYSPLEWICLGCYHGHSMTIWSLGVLLYVMVCRNLPFWDDCDIVLGQLFFRNRLQVTGALWALSPESQNLIRSCLSKHHMDRPELQDLLRHPWVQG